MTALLDLDLGLDAAGMLWASAVIFAAAFARGYSGFGFSAILMGGLVSYIPAYQLVPLSIALEVIASSGQARGIFYHINKRYLILLLVAGFIGNPFGVYLLGAMSETVLRVSIYLTILLASTILLLGTGRSWSPSTSVLILAGLLAGIVNGATALSGLVLALFFASTAVPSATMRATMIAYFFFTDIWTGGFLAAAGNFEIQTIQRIIVVLPILGLGIWLGSRRFLATPPESFRTYVLWMLLCLCIFGVGQMVSQI